MVQILKEISVAVLKGTGIAAAIVAALTALYFVVLIGLIFAVVEFGYDFLNIMAGFRAALDQVFG